MKKEQHLSPPKRHLGKRGVASNQNPLVRARARGWNQTPFPYVRRAQCSITRVSARGNLYVSNLSKGGCPMVQTIGIIMFGLLVGTYSALLGLGGGLFMVPLMVALGYDVKVATATSLAVIIPTAVSSVLRELSDQRVEWWMALWLAMGAILGTFIGIPLKNYVDSDMLLRIFAALLLLMALESLKVQVWGVELTLRTLIRLMIGLN